MSGAPGALARTALTFLVVGLFVACDRPQPAAVAGGEQALPAAVPESATPSPRDPILWDPVGRSAAEVAGGLRVTDRWFTDAPVSSGPLSADGVLYVGLVNGEVVALDSEGGGVLWSEPLSEPTRELGGLAEGVLAVTDSSLTALRAGDGSALWSVPFDHDGPSAALSSGQAGVYLAMRDASLHAISSEGQLRWSAILPAPAAGSLALFDGAVLAITQLGHLVRVDAATGETEWTVTLGGSFFGGPAVNRAGFPGETAVVSSQGEVSIIAPDGSLAVEFDPGGIVMLANPFWVGDQLIIAQADGEISAYTRSGTRLWSSALDSHLAGSPTVFRNLAVAADSGGGVVALDLSSGDRITSVTLPAAIDGPATLLGHSSDRVELAVRLRGGQLARLSVNEEVERAPLLDGTRSYVLPAQGVFRLRDEEVRLSLGSSTDAVFEIDVGSSPAEPLVLELEDETGAIVSTNMGKVALARTIRAPLAAGLSYELVIRRPEASGEITVTIRTVQL